MRSRLFDEDIESFIRKIVETAVRESNIALKHVTNNNVEQEVSRFIEKYIPRIARLEPENKRGADREIEIDPPREVHMRFPRQEARKVIVIDVTIPFTGHPDTLKLRATHKVHLNTQDIQLIQNAVIVSFPDDGQLEQSVDRFVADVSTNLEHVQRDLAQIEGRLKDAVMANMSARLQRLEEQAARDGARSFPITRHLDK